VSAARLRFRIRADLGTIKIIENANFSLEHKNKYGQDYVPPANTSPVYGGLSVCRSVMQSNLSL